MADETTSYNAGGFDDERYEEEGSPSDEVLNIDEVVQLDADGEIIMN